MASSHEPKPFKIEPLNYLLIFLPIAIVLKLTHYNDTLLFLASCVAIIPLAGLMGRATENLADNLGPGIGGLLNATFGNAAELIIALFLLAKGKVDFVKASLTGSILGNMLLVLGLSILAGGVFHKKQLFNRTAASLGATLLGLAGIGLIIPTAYFYIVVPPGQQAGQATIMLLSEEIAVILAVIYVLSLVFNLWTHQHLFAGPETEQELHEVADWSQTTSLTVLVLSTVGVALVAEFLVGSIEEAARALGMNSVFIGVIVVAVVGNAAEHSTAVLVAMKNKMDLAVTIAIGSSIQVALFVAPVLLFASLLMGTPMNFHFTPMEVVAILIAITVTHLVTADGECHWMEGVMLLAVYLMLALAFYHLPEHRPTGEAPDAANIEAHESQTRLEPIFEHCRGIRPA